MVVLVVVVVVVVVASEPHVLLASVGEIIVSSFSVVVGTPGEVPERCFHTKFYLYHCTAWIARIAPCLFV